MKKLIRRQPDNGHAAHPGGNTLVEVLVSLLVFGIGAVAVATLFPVSILQSINATRLTRGTIHRYNAEAMVNLYPNPLIFDPDRNNNFREHFDRNTPGAGADIPPAQAQPGGVGAMPAGGYAGNNYVVDPLGWEMIRASEEAATGDANVALMVANRFGNNGTNWLPRYNAFNNRLAPINLGAAQDLVISPDSWVQTFDGFLEVQSTAADSVSVTGLTQGDAGQIEYGQRPRTRVTIFDSTQRFSHTRILTGRSFDPTNNQTTLTWAAGNPLPAGFTAASVRVEAQEYQFSWLLTVRNRSASQSSQNATVDVVIFFRRPITKDAERVYAVTPITGSGGRGFQITVPAGAPQPFLKRGSYLCDIINARWHRIQRIANEGTSSPQVWLEHEPPVGEVVQEVVIPQGVVEVYPLGTKVGSN